MRWQALGANVQQRVAQQFDVLGLQHERRQQPQDVRIAAGASKYVALEQCGVAVEQVVVAAAWVAAVGAAAHQLGELPWAQAIGSLVAGAATVAACGAYFRKRVGGVTGDFLGASQQLSECAMLLTFAVLRGNH